MNANQIYRKTMKFVWLKLALGAAVMAASALLAAIMFGISLAAGGGAFGIVLLIWALLTALCFGLAEHFVGYMLKAGHVAAVTRIATGNIPEDPFAYGWNAVKGKFPTAAAYFAIDRLISGAVRQINSGLDVVGNILGRIPGMDHIVSFAKSFVNIALGNVDECCLAYTFFHEEQSSFKSAADGVVIYFQNWKTILKSALKLALLSLVFTIVTGLVLTIVLFAIITSTGLPGMGTFFIALILAALLVGSVKSAFLDSYTMVSMLCTYMEVAPSAQINFDLYGKLCNLSGKFKSLFHQGQNTKQPGMPA